MRVMEKGQVTIPKPIRDMFGIGPRSEIEFIEANNIVRRVRASEDTEPPKDLEEFRRWFDANVARMHGTIDTMGMQGKECADWLRGPRDDIDPS